MGIFSSWIKTLLGKQFARDVDSVDKTTQVYDALREANEPEADALAANLADSALLFVHIWVAGSPLELARAEDVRRQVLAARAAGEEWLAAKAKAA